MSSIGFGHSHSPHSADYRPTAAASAPLAWVPAGWKFSLMVLLVVGTALMPLRYWAWHAGVGLLLLALALAGRIAFLKLLKRLVVLAPFVAATALATSWHGATGPGWPTVAVRGGVCLVTVLVFAAITPFGALPAFLRRLGVPFLLVTTMALMHRYLFVLVDESDRMRRARACRTFSSQRSLRWSLSADVIGRLFVRASERAERIYLAMCARGWK